jgi:NADH-quinone oxidoreductase subunit J
MALSTFLFWAIALLTGLCALMVVVTQNIVRMAAWLLFTLAGTAGVFFLLGADFVGATQLIVYVGGILVLVVFGVMLTAQGPFITMKTSAAEWAVSGVVGLLLFGILAACMVLATWPEATSPPERDAATSTSSSQLGRSFLGMTDATPEAKLPLPGKELPRQRMSYFLPFEIVSVHLVVVLIGAAYLARAKRRRGATA